MIVLELILATSFIQKQTLHRNFKSPTPSLFNIGLLDSLQKIICLSVLYLQTTAFSTKILRKSLNFVNKHVFICSNAYIYTTVVYTEVYNRDRFPEVDDVENLAAAATKHLGLLKQKDKAESSVIIVELPRLSFSGFD